MTLAEKLAVWQKDLMDMSRMNYLLYYRSSGRGAGISLGYDDVSALFAQLDRSTRRIPISWEMPPEDNVMLERRLSRLRASVREDVNDRGIQTLFVAFGLLEWREAGQSDEIIRSPLVLVPVTLAREGVLGNFTLQRDPDRETEINPTLREKLAHDFRIQLPTYEELAAAIQVAGATTSGSTTTTSTLRLPDILDRLRAAIPPEHNWRIVVEAHLGRFSFQKLVMYHDLRDHADVVLSHPVLKVIAGNRLSPPFSRDAIAAHELDQRLRPHEVMEILDADSSQQEAIRAAKAGASFVLQGPPGTGKSQTIANIIAECLAGGKRVLFVSEKMAALDVVRQRLRNAGLDDFCLDLHNVKADKKLFIAELSNALNIAQSGIVPDREREWRQQSDTLLETRQTLNDYVRELHLPRFALSQSAFDVYGKLAELGATPFLDFALTDVEKTDTSRLDHMRDALENLLHYAEVLDEGDEYPWHDTLVRAHTLELEGDIQGHFRQLIGALQQWNDLVSRLRAHLGEDLVALSFASAQWSLHRAYAALQAPFPPPRSWLRADNAVRLATAAEDLTARSASYHLLRHQFDPLYQESLLDRDHARLLSALTDDAEETAQAIIPPAGQSPHDALLHMRDELDQHLHTIMTLAPELTDAAADLARACAQDAPTTEGGIAYLLRGATCILTGPNPPQPWLDPARFPTIRALVLDAAERYTACATSRQSLEAIYAPAFFELDHTDFARRFREQYHSIVRFVWPQYYADVKRIRGTALQPEPKRSGAEIGTDVAQAEKLLREEDYLRAHRVEHITSLDRFFNGPQTPWDDVRATLRWTEEYYACFGSDGANAETLRVITAAGQTQATHRETIQALHARVAELYQAWQREQAWLRATCSFAALFAGNAQDASSLAHVRNKVEAIRTTLQAFWAAADEVRAHVRSTASASTDWIALCTALRLAQHIRAADTWLAEKESAFSAEYGERFDGYATDWDTVLRGLRWSRDFAALYGSGQVPDALANVIAHDADPTLRQRFSTLYSQAIQLAASIQDDLRFVDSVLPRPSLIGAAPTLEAAPVLAVRARLQHLLDHLHCLEQWLQCRQAIEDCRGLGLGQLLDVALRRRPFPRDIAPIFEQRFYMRWLDAARKASPVLARFHGETHNRTIERFQQLDNHHIRLARAQVYARLKARAQAALRAVEEAADDEETPIRQAFVALKKEARLKRHGSIRQIVRRVAPALLELKPCWMMSPQSVSQFVGAGEPLFDLVIFDEASQVCPEDAIGAILRGRQLVVVGDSKQLPPTRFFAKSLSDSDDDEDADENDAVRQAEQERTESILDECRGASFPERSLRWHYRSRHESLIAFSNRHFYHDQLVTFPSPSADHGAGVRFVYLPDGVYDRSGTRTNKREAERVVELVLDHLRTKPNQSPGVVTLSEAQRQAVRDVIEAQRRAQDPDVLAWDQELAEENPAGFFVKNLESVQGDERDVIILSLGYGPDANNRVYTNFGPVNRERGERRLNVAITRARHQVILVSSMRADRLPADISNPGVRTLRAYLDYAERGPVALETQQISVDAEPRFDSPFEEAVYNALTARGLELDTQVGCSGYRIDMAVRDPAREGTYTLGIECDGRTYHSSATARDRDRLRQRHLEGMGWTIHRIWSSDWRANPVLQVELVLNKLHELRTARARVTPDPVMARSPHNAPPR